MLILGRWVAVVLAAVVGAACVGPPSAFVPIGNVAMSFPVEAPVTDVRVDFAVGAVRVVPATGDKVTVSGEVRVRENRRDEFAGPLVFEDHVAVSLDGGRLVVESAHAGAADADDWSLHLEVAVPGELAVTARLAVGQIAIELPAVTAVHARVGAGDVGLRSARVRGPVDMAVSVGAVRVSITESAPREAVRLKAVTGDVRLTLPSAAEGAFNLSAGVGSVMAAERFGIEVQRRVVSESGSGQVGAGGPSYDLSTDVGSVRLN